MYRRRRIVAVSAILLLGVLALVLATFFQQPSSGPKEWALPIDSNSAVPDVVLAQTSGVYISSPIRPELLTGLGYHPDGESLIGMSPRGKNLSANPLFDIFSRGSTPEKIQYYLMDPANRQGPNTGALDVGAEAGSAVYAPVTGTVTAVRPDPALRGNAYLVEIKPTDNPNVRVLVSLVSGMGGGVGPKSSVTAGVTQLGSVADSAKVLKPQLASYSFDAGNHVTVSVSEAGN